MINEQAMTARNKDILNHAVALFTAWQTAQFGLNGQIPKECEDYGKEIVTSLSTAFSETSNAFDLKAGQKPLGFNFIARNHAVFGVSYMLGEMIWKNANYCFGEMELFYATSVTHVDLKLTPQEIVSCKFLLFQLFLQNITKTIQVEIENAIKMTSQKLLH